MANRAHISATANVVEYRDNDNYRFAINFDIPVAISEQDQAYQTCLVRIRNYIAGSFLPRPENCYSCRFQVTATYIIKLPNNNERLWTGSFFNSDNHLTVLSGVNWREFIPESFVGFVTRCTLPDNVISTLDWGNRLDTQWSFDRLVSIIVAFQVVVKFPNHAFHEVVGFGIPARGQGFVRMVQLNGW